MAVAFQNIRDLGPISRASMPVRLCLSLGALVRCRSAGGLAINISKVHFQCGRAARTWRYFSSAGLLLCISCSCLLKPVLSAARCSQLLYLR